MSGNTFWKKLKDEKRAEKEPFFALAPMADVTDWPFRQVISKCGRPDVFWTEFVSADGLCSEGEKKLLPLLYFTDNERPIVAQLFGKNPDTMYKAAKLVAGLGFDGLDINMGCPDRKILKQGAGIALHKTPELAQEVILAAKDGVGDIPVSIKTRLGWNEIDMHGWILKLLKTKPAALTVHLRTMKEMSKVPAHWELAKELTMMAHDAGSLFIGNGDIKTKREGIIRAELSGADGIMIGRGIFQDPWLFAKNSIKENTKENKIQLLADHLELFHSFWGNGKRFDTMKKFFKIYISGWDGAKKTRDKLMTTKSTREAIKQVKQLTSGIQSS